MAEKLRQAVRLRLARHRRRRRLTAGSGLVAVAAAATIVAVSIFNSSHKTALTVRPSGRGSSSAPGTSASTFATINISENPPVESVQIRSLADGHVLRTLSIGSGRSVADASPGPHGSLLVADTDSHCQATVERVNVGTGDVTILRHINRTVVEMALSPDGRYLAYVTSPTCPETRGDTEVISPGVLAVVNLATGSTRTLGQAGNPKAPLEDQGRSYEYPSWSPTSRQIVVDYQTDWSKLLIVPVGHLTRSSSTKIHSPIGCSYASPLWTDAGIVATEACGPSPSSRLSPHELVEVSATGTIRRTWTLPACTGGFQIQERQPAGPIVVELDIGYGDKACSHRYLSRLSELTPTGLRTIINLPEHAHASLAS
jgi:hypothetical protein